MLEITQVDLKSAAEVARIVPIQRAPNGIRYGCYGNTQLSASDLEQIVQAIPQTIAAALQRKAYYFVPLALAESPQSESPDSGGISSNPEAIQIASDVSDDLTDNAICHRNATIAGVDCIFISTRLMQDRFALAFELYINAGHHFVDAAGVPQTFMSLIWSQVEADVRGETSQDAWEHRARALGRTSLETGERWVTPQPRSRRKRPLEIAAASTAPIQKSVVDEKSRTEYFEAAFADAIAIYLLSLTVDFDYTELREREYPLLAAPALAERLRHVAQLFPPNAGREFSIRPRVRNN